MRISYMIILHTVCVCIFGCAPVEKSRPDTEVNFKAGEFGFDKQFLKKYHADAVVLTKGEAQVIVLPAYQGRVMTSSAGGEHGKSYGWINYSLIESGKIKEHMNAFGGEDRFWLGPEGGQYSIYFEKGLPFTFENWFVPKALDTEPFTLLSSNDDQASFEKTIQLTNYSGHKFDLKVNRSIKLMAEEDAATALGMKVPANLKFVGFESENVITNTGDSPWTSDTGALSIWILGMFNASDSARVVVPFRDGDERTLGRIVTDDYFGKVPSDRLKIKNGFMVFQADAKFRSKIGISPNRVLPWLCSYDPSKQLLTIVQFSLPDSSSEYVNSQWKIQTDPFKGDVVNSYNDGPLENGEQLGHFYELESSSPAAFLKPGENMRHIHRTMHFEGSTAALDELIKGALKLQLHELKLQ